MRIELVDALAPHTVQDDGALSLPAFETGRGPQMQDRAAARPTAWTSPSSQDPDGSCAAATVDLVRETIRYLTPTVRASGAS